MIFATFLLEGCNGRDLAIAGLLVGAAVVGAFIGGIRCERRRWQLPRRYQLPPRP